MDIKSMQSSTDDDFLTFVLDLMPKIGPVTFKRMFRGYGIFIDEVMFAIVTNGELFLKTDPSMEKDLTAMNLAAFSYERKDKKTVSLSYYQAPYEVFDDASVMQYWIERAYDAAFKALSVKIKRNPSVKI